MSGKQIQKWLFDYLSIDIDPFDFSMYLNEWFETIGHPQDDEAAVDDLTEVQRHEFEEWLWTSDKAGEWLQQEPFDSPPYLTLHAQEKLPPGTWLAHFTRDGSFREFDRGTDLRGLHLSTYKKNKDFVDCKKNLKSGIFETVYGFAFEAESRFVQQKVRYNGDKYGDYVLLFQCDFGVLARHDGDEEDQVIFPLCSEYNIAGFSIDGGLLGEVGDEGESILFNSVEDAIRFLEDDRSPRLRGYGG